jgi:hypothetical protein
MKSIAIFFAMSGLTACASSSSAIEGVTSTKGTLFIMLGARPADQVADCIGRILNATVSRQGNEYIVAKDQNPPALGVNYRIRTINDPYSRFLTQVEQTGYASDSASSIGECLPVAS